MKMRPCFDEFEFMKVIGFKLVGVANNEDGDGFRFRLVNENNVEVFMTACMDGVFISEPYAARGNCPDDDKYGGCPRTCNNGGCCENREKNIQALNRGMTYGAKETLCQHLRLLAQKSKEIQDTNELIRVSAQMNEIANTICEMDNWF